mmetsp:Transcript_21063/g.53325  ORF Transcript_21063/g.53325 Transcript_21063/m.53325 type:complete len:199 (+) Transcript_21063:56-652(+)
MLEEERWIEKDISEGKGEDEFNQHADQDDAYPTLFEDSFDEFDALPMPRHKLDREESRRKMTLCVVAYGLDLVLVSAWAFALGALFTLPYCGLLFRCGCTWVWAGGIERCNIFDPEAPSCPFCTLSSALAWIPQWGTALLSIFTTLCVCWIPQRLSLHRLGWLVRVLLPIACFFVYTFLLALIVKLASPHYPYFLWLG